VGKHDLEDLVFFHVCRTKETRGMVYALNKDTGETVWSKSLKYYGWSSPTCLYTPAGKGYVLVGSSNGVLHLLDGLTGNEVANVELRGNIEGTPAVFDDMIVVGTRSNAIYGVKIS
jgi:outer membrane protein assembly factor BamB